MRTSRLVELSSIVASLSILFCALWYGRFGFEFTDDGYYLAWAAHRSRYLWSVSQFAFVYGPTFDVLGRNVALYRILNLLLIFGLASTLAGLWIRAHLTELTTSTQITAAIGLSTSALGIVGAQLSTPNYNTLAFTGMLLTSIGLVLASKRYISFATLGGVLTGTGGWLCFMAKPSTAAALAVCVFILALLSAVRSFRFWVAAALSVTGLLWSSARLIDGSVERFIERLRLGYDMQVLSGAGYSSSSLFRWDPLILTSQDAAACLIAFFGTISAACLVDPTRPRLANGSLFAPPILVVWIIVGALGWIALGQWATALSSFPLLGICLGAGSSSIMARPALASEVQTPIWPIACAFLLFPHVFAFGTNNNHWSVGSNVAFFWVLAGLAPLMAYVRLPNAIIAVTAATQIVSALALYGGIQQPYRQPAALWMNMASASVGSTHSNLRIDAGYAAYIAEVRDKTTRSGFQSEPILDFTGQSPGLLYALNATPVGYPWLAGGYSGSANVLISSLKLESCRTLSSAWLLMEPGGPRAIDTNTLAVFSLKFPSEYRLAASWQTVQGMGGYDKPRLQQLWAPIDKTRSVTDCGLTRTDLLGSNLNH